MNLKQEQENMRIRVRQAKQLIQKNPVAPRRATPRKFKTYFVLGQTTGKIKIGRSFDPQKRLTTMQTGSAEPLILLAVIDKDCEKRMHKKFLADHSHGEWYFPENILTFLKRKFHEFIQ